MQQFGYFLLCIERELGWGSRDDGWMIFRTEADADTFLKDEYNKRKADSVVPDYYVEYRKDGFKPISEVEGRCLLVKQYVYR